MVRLLKKNHFFLVSPDIFSFIPGYSLAPSVPCGENSRGVSVECADCAWSRRNEMASSSLFPFQKLPKEMTAKLTNFNLVSTKMEKKTNTRKINKKKKKIASFKIEYNLPYKKRNIQQPRCPAYLEGVSAFSMPRQIRQGVEPAN